MALLCAWVQAQTPVPPPAPVPQTQETAEAEPGSSEEAAATGESAAVQNRTSLNLLGQANTERGESRRNENVQISLIDNNATRELNTRVGTSATLVDEFRPDRGYFMAEIGNAPRAPLQIPGISASGVHGNFFWNHNNSILSARSFFQVGSVQPARANQYGANVGSPLWKGAFLNASLSQQKNRGQVNGNVLIPLPEERTPLTTDPVLRAMVIRVFAAFPNVAPNRPDIADRALNTNSPQLINTDTHNAQITQKVGDRDTLHMRYAFTGQRVDAFQFIVAQNPNTTNKSHNARTTWHRAWNPQTVMDATIGFDRQGTLLLPAAGAVGPLFINGLTGLGPPFDVPRKRAQNRYRASIAVQQQRNRHAITAGFGFTRLQYNGDEPEVARGVFQFNPDFGRDGITNLRYGTPSRHLRSIGTAYAAYRNWDLQAYIGDHWQASNRLSLNYSLRWEPTTRPAEVTGRAKLPYSSDWNNLAPSFGLAYRLPKGVLRASYGVMFGQIFPVSYGIDRYNTPFNSRVIVQAPYFADPLAGVNLNPADPNIRSSRYVISPNLVTPYSHQYNLSWETEIGRGWKLQTGFVGSRTHKLFFTYVTNRARVIPGIPLITATVAERRDDPKSFEVVDLHNGGRAFYDAGIATITTPRWSGLTLNASYWFSKSIDLGTDYTYTGVGNSSRDAAGQDGVDVHKDQKGLSDFDQPHAALVQAAFDTGGGYGPLKSISRGWTLASVVLVKSGTPFQIVSGSDGPGFGNVDGMQGDRPMLLDPAVLGRIVGNPDVSQQLLPESAFRFIDAPRETAGSLGRNTFRKGKIANVNASLQRTWVLAQEWQMTLRAESINFFNTPQFSGPGDNLASPNFAQITNTLNDGRTFRFTLRLNF